MRPRQWTKNLLVFAGIVFAAKLGDPGRWADAATAFVAFCAASSAAYLVNDVRDAEHDRLHPTKNARPIARRELAPRAALALAGGLALAAVALTAALGLSALLYLGAFLALQAAYTLALKEVVLVDVMAIGALFVVRAAAGANAVRVPISPWLLLCTALLALFLGLAKRRGELVLVGADATPGRPVLAGYSLELVDQPRQRRRGVHRDCVRPLHVLCPGLEGDDGDDSLRPVRGLPLSAADPPARSGRGARERPAFRPPDPALRGGLGGLCRRNPPRYLAGFPRSRDTQRG